MSLSCSPQVRDGLSGRCFYLRALSRTVPAACTVPTPAKIHVEIQKLGGNQKFKRQILKTRRDVSFTKGLSNEPTFGLIHLAGQYL
jgi:hypothetical protein